MTDIRRDARLSPCGKYRYLLSRIWNEPGEVSGLITYVPPHQLVFVMLNPSTADAFEDDPTIRRCISFGKRENFDMIHVANLYAGRATRPDDLFAMEDPEGPENRRVWEKLKSSSATIVCAWGAERRAVKQGEDFIEAMRGKDLFCLGMTKEGHPRHPLYLKRDAQIEPFVLTPRSSPPHTEGG